MLDVSRATGALEIVTLPAVLLVVAVKLAVTATEVPRIGGWRNTGGDDWWSIGCD